MEPSSDESMKSSSFLVDTLLDPATAHSEDTSNAACFRVLKTNFFDHIYAPGNEYKAARFHSAMSTFSSPESSVVVPGGFPWEELPKGTRVVDVGGGVGTACREVMKKNPLLNFTVQDLPSVAEQATTVSISKLC